MDSLAGQIDAFLELRHLLWKKAEQEQGSSYRVPTFLLERSHDTGLRDVGDPYLYYAKVCDHILDSPARSTPEIREGDVVYLSFIRTFSALDDRIGTALSQIAFLPFIRNCLGARVFISLPTGVIGQTNRRGSRGSPFAIADPFGTDPSLGDPLIPEMTAHDQYRALTQACLWLGLRLGSVIPTATLSLDSPLLRDDPDLTFWWDAIPGESLTTMPSDLDEYAARPRFLPHRPEVTTCRFSEPPESPATEVCSSNGERFLIGHARDGRQVTVANAFTDVHPEDSDCAVWPDVALLNYTSLPYPYFAGAETGSLFDSSRPACALMQRIIEWRHSEFEETVFLVDLCANVPSEVLDVARSNIADRGSTATFIGEELWSFDARNNGVDAIVGPLPYCVSAHTRNRGVLVESLRYHLRLLGQRKLSDPYFAGLSNHDTMPPLPEHAALLFTCYSFLPGAITLIFSGSEWHAQTATNPEFGLSTTDRLRSIRRALGPNERALFNDVPLSWPTLPDSGRFAPLPPLIEELARMRQNLGVDSSWTYSFWTPQSAQPDCFGYCRENEDRNMELTVAVNWSEGIVEVETLDDPKRALDVSSSGFQALADPGRKVPIYPGHALALISRAT